MVTPRPARFAACSGDCARLLPSTPPAATDARLCRAPSRATMTAMARHTPSPRPRIRRDAEGGTRTAPDWESLTERLIREAQDAGAFDDLPGRGQRLRLVDETAAGDMALAYHLLHNAGAVPPWIAADQEARELESRIAALLERAIGAGVRSRQRLEGELEALVDQHDTAVLRLEGLAPTARQQRRRLERARVREQLRLALAAETRSP